MSYIATLKSLRSLSINYCPLISDEGMEQVKDDLVNEKLRLQIEKQKQNGMNYQTVKP